METRKSFGFPLTVAVRTDVGQVRSNNEDAFGVRWLEDGSLLAIVADGMGGHEAGEVASGLAIRVLEEAIGRDPEQDPRERMYNGLVESNTSIIEEGRALKTHGMGTTAIIGLFKGSEVHVGMVGDSRLYHFRRGHLLWRTLDHTRVQMLVDQGEISEDDARAHPESGMLTRALGHARMADGRPLVPDVLAEPLFIEHDDLIVLSSDGLHDLLEDWEIGQMASGVSPEEACERLVAEANQRGGHDNITVAVISAGEISAAYDPSFEPQEHVSVAAAPPEAEVTYDGIPDTQDDLVMGVPDAATGAPGAQRKWILGMAAVVIALALGGGLVLFAGAVALMFLPN